MTADLVCDALQMARWKRKMPKGVIVHPEAVSIVLRFTNRSIPVMSLGAA